jgi:hypothetical protein
MYSRLRGAEVLRRYPNSRGTVPDARAYDLIDVDVQRVAPDATVVRVCGEIDMLTAPILQAELDGDSAGGVGCMAR